MGTKTTFLELTLPDNGEYVDNWDTVVNNNFEDLDDYASDLNDDLVGTTGDTGNLKGTAASLQERIDAGLNSGGDPKLDNAPDFTSLENSKHYGVSSAGDQGQRVLDRLHFVENDLVACRFGEFSDRYGGTTTMETISGISKISRLHNAYGTVLPSGDLVPSLIRGFTPNSAVDGPKSLGVPVQPTHISSAAATDLILGGGTPTVPTVYNIDGLWFEIADEVAFEIGGGGHSGLSPTSRYLIWASRNEADYNSSGSLQWYYDTWCGTALGAAYRINLRKIPTHASLVADENSSVDPSDGSISLTTPSRLTSALAINYSLLRAGDILVITSPSTVAGEYLVESASGTNLDIFGTFPITASQSGISFRIERRTMPALGFTLASSAVPTSGRIIIGEFTTDGSGTVNTGTIIPYAYNGMHDTGWRTLSAVGGLPYVITHNLGALPSQVDVFVKRDSDDTIEKNPTLKLSVQSVDVAGGSLWGTTDVRFPAFGNYSTDTSITVTTLNPVGGTNLYHESDGAESLVANSSAANSIRVIVRR